MTNEEQAKQAGLTIGEWLKIQNENYARLRKDCDLQLIKWLQSEEVTQEQWNEIARALQNYHVEYGIECFKDKSFVDW